MHREIFHILMDFMSSPSYRGGSNVKSWDHDNENPLNPLFDAIYCVEGM